MTTPATFASGTNRNATFLGAVLLTGLFLGTAESRADMTAGFAPAGVSAAPDGADVGWLGIGVRGGMNQLSLSAARAVNVVGGARGQQLLQLSPELVRTMDIDTQMREIVPTVHLGGSGYYFKLEAPFRQSADLQTWGIGVYPINLGVHLRRLRVMPTLSLGGVLSYAKSRDTDLTATFHQAIGGLFEAKIGLGLKIFPLRGLAISLDVARTPWAAGGIYSETGAEKAEEKASAGRWGGISPGTVMRGGIGDGWELTLGLEWL